MERLTERNEQECVSLKDVGFKPCASICYLNNSCSNCPLDNALRKLATYEDAEEQGLLLRLPCEPTDEVLNMIYKLCELHSNADGSYDNPKESEMKEAEAKLEELRGVK